MCLRVCAIAGSGFLLFQAVRKRSSESVVLAGIAAALIGAVVLWPTSRGRKPEDEVEDIVDLASELSFPASDPPAY